VEIAPDIDSKYFASTQVIDEARHVEVFSRYLDTKVGQKRPIDGALGSVLENILSENRWDVVFLGMQIIAEGYALANIRLNSGLFPDPLIKEIAQRVARDEARHMSFGMLALDGHARELTGAELRDREEFICEALTLLSRRVGVEGTWKEMGLGGSVETWDDMSKQRNLAFRRTLFGRILPSIGRLGFFTPRIRDICEELGIKGR